MNARYGVLLKGVLYLIFRLISVVCSTEEQDLVCQACRSFVFGVAYLCSQPTLTHAGCVSDMLFIFSLQH